MNANVVYLHPPPSEIAHFHRVGLSGHRQLEHLLSANKVPCERFVIEAASFAKQMDLVRALHETGAEIVLDTNAAELSTIRRFDGSMREAPWAQADRPLDELDFVAGTNRSVIEPIARFASIQRVTSVLAPTHLIEHAGSPWLEIDGKACLSLRKALDHEGGKDIAIDYTLITTYALLRDPISRRQILQQLRDLPFENLWLRISGHGADATPTGIRRYIASAFDFQQLEKPIIADYVGGFAALAFAAFGAGGGFAHGVGTKERFSAADWNKPRSKSGGQGGKRIFIPGLDRHLYMDGLGALFDTARTARAILGCSDRACCGDIDTMLRNPDAHQLRQQALQLKDLSKTPESQRANRFLTNHLTAAERKAKQAAKIKTKDESIKQIFQKSRDRLERMQEVLGNLNQTLGETPLARPVRLRASKTEIQPGKKEGQP